LFSTTAEYDPGAPSARFDAINIEATARSSAYALRSNPSKNVDAVTRVTNVLAPAEYSLSI